MRFYHKVEPDFIFNLFTTSLDNYVVWVRYDKFNYVWYSKQEVDDNLSDGTWILIDE